MLERERGRERELRKVAFLGATTAATTARRGAAAAARELDKGEAHGRRRCVTPSSWRRRGVTRYSGPM